MHRWTMQSFLVNGGVKHAAEDGVVGGPGSPMSVVHYYVDHLVCVLLDIYHTLWSKWQPCFLFCDTSYLHESVTYVPMYSVWNITVLKTIHVWRKLRVTLEKPTVCPPPRKYAESADKSFHVEHLKHIVAGALGQLRCTKHIRNCQRKP